MRFTLATFIAALAATAAYAHEGSFTDGSGIARFQTTIETTTSGETAADKKKWNDQVIKDAAT